jgi:uncharacterized membrane protein YqhA
MRLLDLKMLWIFGIKLDLIIIAILGIFLLSSLFSNNKKSSLEDNLSIVIFIVILIVILTFLGWFYSLGDK